MAASEALVDPSKIFNATPIFLSGTDARKTPSAPVLLTLR